MTKFQLTRENKKINQTLEKGIKAYLAKDYEKASKYFKKALKINPNDIRARMNLAPIYSLQGKKEEAIQEIQKAYEQNPGVTRKIMIADKDFALIKSNPEFKKLLKKKI